MEKQGNQSFNEAVVGHMAGGMVKVDNRSTVNNINHYTENHQHTHHHEHTNHVHAYGQVVLQTTLVQQAPAFALQASTAPPARQGRRPKLPTRDITPAQREALALMRPLPKPVRVDVLIWMRMEFGTSLVMDLDPRELLRLRQHLAGVRLGVGDVTMSGALA